MTKPRDFLLTLTQNRDSASRVSSCYGLVGVAARLGPEPDADLDVEFLFVAHYLERRELPGFNAEIRFNVLE